MSQVLGTAQVNITADTSALISKLHAATTMVSQSISKMSGTMVVSGGMMQQAIVQTMNVMERFGGNTKRAMALSKTLLTTVKVGAIALGAAMIASSEQAERLMGALGQLSQVTIDRTIGPAIDHIAHAISALATNIKNFGFAEGFERTFSQSTKVGIVAVAGAIMGALIPALNTLRITLLTQIPIWWSAIAPLLPFIAIGAAVAVLAYLLWQNWSTVTQWLQTAWNTLWTGAVTIFNGIVNAITTAWNWVVTNTTALWNTIAGFVVGVATFIWNGLVSIFNSIVSFFQEWGVTILVALTFPLWAVIAFFAWVWSKIGDDVMHAWNVIVAWLTSVWNEIVIKAQAIWNGIISILTPIWNALVSIAMSVWNLLKNKTLAIWNGLKAELLAIWNAIKSVVSPIYHAIASIIQSVWNKIKSVTSSLWNGIKSWLTSNWNSVKSTAGSVWNGVTSAITGAWNSLKSKAASIWSGIYSTISRWINKALNAIRPFIRGFNSVVSKVNSLTGAKLPTISMPGLAKGGIVTAPTMAVVGEGRYSEAVLPLSDKTFSALAAGITQNMSGGKGTTIHVHASKASINERDLANIFRRTEWLMGV
jgi:phage-related protein